MNSTVLYLTISEGPRADKTRPILALSDQRLIAHLLDALRDLAGPMDDGDAPRTTPDAGVAKAGER
ncbi:MAG TPA: hypothetical protein VIL85_23910 [Thermomicrobiales bacterium]